MNKIYVIFNHKNVPYFYAESVIINEVWLLAHGILNFDIVETPLDVDHFKALCYENLISNLNN